tara:strand:+ start:1038 stop:1262 length:225 start_codon:yes stop_codon:yes gene_type:complete
MRLIWKENTMFLVVWTDCHKGRKDEPTYEDHWLAFESFIEATENYDKLLKLDEVYSASVCGVIQSTDFEGLENE